MATRGLPIYLGGNDDEPEKTVTIKTPATGVLEPATGLLGLTFVLSATPTGSAIDASLDVDATERGSLGIYYAHFAGTDLVAHLAAYAGGFVYEIFGDGVNINYVTARIVRAVRP